MSPFFAFVAATGYWVSALSPNMDVANAAVPTFAVLNMLTSTFLIRLSDIGWWWRWCARGCGCAVPAAAALSAFTAGLRAGGGAGEGGGRVPHLPLLQLLPLLGLLVGTGRREQCCCCSCCLCKCTPAHSPTQLLTPPCSTRPWQPMCRYSYINFVRWAFDAHMGNMFGGENNIEYLGGETVLQVRVVALCGTVWRVGGCSDVAGVRAGGVAGRRLQ